MLLDGLSSVTKNADPSSKSAQASGKLQENLNSFLNLLVTQLKNQDPMDPLKANEFTSQLVQFASVEQQIYQNANLEKLVSLQQTSQTSDMVNYLGTSIESKGNQTNYDGNPVDFTYALKNNASSVTISVRDQSGVTVFSADGDSTAGAHNFTWDGTNDFGNNQKKGVYTIIVSAQNAAGDLLDVSQTIFGKVTGAGVTDGKVNLFVGDVKVSMDDVVSVREPPKPAP
ncbi:MAG TPA: flagellar hook assembly protein FlgD [Alphaproteobacteria bacterium]|nr:flagellar hook assembly protein FlgD [Alphaproteobacteria bacterium]